MLRGDIERGKHGDLSSWRLLPKWAPGAHYYRRHGYNMGDWGHRGRAGQHPPSQPTRGIVTYLSRLPFDPCPNSNSLNSSFAHVILARLQPSVWV